MSTLRPLNELRRTLLPAWSDRLNAGARSPASGGVAIGMGYHRSETARTPRGGPGHRRRRAGRCYFGAGSLPAAIALSLAPAEILTVFVAGTWSGSPVAGLRPVRAARKDCWKEMKPGMVIFSSPEATVP